MLKLTSLLLLMPALALASKLKDRILLAVTDASPPLIFTLPEPDILRSVSLVEFIKAEAVTSTKVDALEEPVVILLVDAAAILISEMLLIVTLLAFTVALLTAVILSDPLEMVWVVLVSEPS